jgi:AcrR family transcriptional regulator
LSAADRRARQKAEREDRIIATARDIAEREGWSAVTVRRLADEIEYSQPVLYAHFRNRDAIVGSVALEGFRDLAVGLRTAARGAAQPGDALAKAAGAYLAFAFRNPALYEAMFVLPNGLDAAEAEGLPEPHEALGALAAVVEPFASDVEAATETFWAALHGLAELERTGRIRPAARAERVRLIVQAFLAGVG